MNGERIISLMLMVKKKKEEVSGFIYDSIHGANMINISALASNHI